jgi:hypothetical protein
MKYPDLGGATPLRVPAWERGLMPGETSQALGYAAATDHLRTATR